MKKLLIVAHAFDGGARAVAHALSASLRQRTLWLAPEHLAQLRWSHTVDAHGHAHTRLQWPGGEALKSDAVGMLWNRIRWLPQPNFRASVAADCDYANAELQALLGSWFAELGVRAEPAMRSQMGPIAALHPLRWIYAAERCGMALASAGSAAETFSVLRTPLGLYGPDDVQWPPAFASACDGVAQELGFAIVEFGFVGRVDGPQLGRVDIRPSLRRLAHVQAVTRWLESTMDAAASPAIAMAESQQEVA